MEQIDANTWHFVLRKGVKFHDGTDFNADAAAFNIRRLYDKRANYDVLKRFFYGFKMEGKAVDSHTLEIKTDKFEPLMPTLMSTLRICSPNTPLDKLTRNPMGTGPYRFVKWIRASRSWWSVSTVIGEAAHDQEGHVRMADRIGRQGGDGINRRSGPHPEHRTAGCNQSRHWINITSIPKLPTFASAAGKRRSTTEGCGLP